MCYVPSIDYLGPLITEQENLWSLIRTDTLQTLKERSTDAASGHRDTCLKLSREHFLWEQKKSKGIKLNYWYNYSEGYDTLATEDDTKTHNKLKGLHGIYATDNVIVQLL